MSTISQLGYSLIYSYICIIILFNHFNIDLDFNIFMLSNLPLSISPIKDKFLHYAPKATKIKIVLLILVLMVNLLLKLNILKSKEYIYG